MDACHDANSSPKLSEFAMKTCYLTASFQASTITSFNGDNYYGLLKIIWTWLERLKVSYNPWGYMTSSHPTVTYFLYFFNVEVSFWWYTRYIIACLFIKLEYCTQLQYTQSWYSESNKYSHIYDNTWICHKMP